MSPMLTRDGRLGRKSNNSGRLWLARRAIEIVTSRTVRDRLGVLEKSQNLRIMKNIFLCKTKICIVECRHNKTTLQKKPY